MQVVGKEETFAVIAGVYAGGAEFEWRGEGGGKAVVGVGGYTYFQPLAGECKR